jgi:hypothetical protein
MAPFYFVMIVLPAIIIAAAFWLANKDDESDG